MIPGYATLGGTREDIVSALSLVMGTKEAEAELSKIEKLIQQRAAAGTAEAINRKMPEIRKQVREEASAVVGWGVAALVGASALIAFFRR